MKKILFGLMALLVSMTLFAERITPDDAALVANNFMNVASASGAKKAVPQKKMVRKATAEENLFYVYENANGEGWVIVAANDAVTPVLAYSETGHFRTDNLPVNVKSWMGKYNKFIEKIEADGVEASEEATEQWKNLRKAPRAVQATVVVGPLIKTTWDQDSPYWNLCPGSGSSKAYTGCVATAMAQVMNYWQWPVQGTGSHEYQPLDPNSTTGAKSKRYGKQSANFGATTYDWANMTNSYSSSSTSAQKTAVATLMFHCGVATEMMYGNYDDGGSGTYTVNYGDWTDPACAQNAFVTYFKYKKSGLTGYMRDGDEYGGTTYYQKWSDDDWTAMIKAELDKKHPIMYGGAGSGGGHSFICDGYNDADYFHFNWGWSGENDGYFKLSSLKPGSGGAGGGSYDFSKDQDVIIGIVPDKQDLPKVTVTWSVDGVETTEQYTQEDALVLPAAPQACSASQVFVGWTKSASVSGNKPADLFTSAAGKTVTEDVTYYAVFATKEAGSAQEVTTTTYTFTTKAWKDATNSWVSDQDGSQYVTSNEGVQVTTNSTGAGATSKNEFNSVSKVVVKYCTNASKGVGGIAITVGNTTKELSVTKVGGVELRDLTYDFEQESGKMSFVVTCTTNSIYVNSIAVTAGSEASYSNYTTSCSGTTDVAPVVVKKSDAVKAIRDGQVVIIRDGEVYNLLGVKL